MWCQRMMDIPTEFDKKDIFSTNRIKLSSIFLERKPEKGLKELIDNLSRNTDVKLQIERNQSYKTIIYISLCLLQWKPRFFLEKENTPILRFTFSEEKYHKSSNNSSILSLNQLLASGIDSKRNIPSDRGNQRSFTRGDKKDKREQRDSEDKRGNLPEQIFLHFSAPRPSKPFTFPSKQSGNEKLNGNVDRELPTRLMVSLICSNFDWPQPNSYYWQPDRGWTRVDEKLELVGGIERKADFQPSHPLFEKPPRVSLARGFVSLRFARCVARLSCMIV